MRKKLHADALQALSLVSCTLNLKGTFHKLHSCGNYVVKSDEDAVGMMPDLSVAPIRRCSRTDALARGYFSSLLTY